MAVVRITFPDNATVSSFADALEFQPDMERGVREVRRVLDRHGWVAELTEPEVAGAFSVRHLMSPRARLLAERAEERRAVVAEYDRACRVRALAAGDRRRAEFAAARET